MPPATIYSLPNELLIGITTYLPLPAQLAFKLSGRELYARLPAIKPSQQAFSQLSTCSKLALYSYIQFDKDRRRCALCKQWFPNRLFKSTEGGTKEEEDAERARVLRDGHGDLGGPGMIDLPDSLCAWDTARVVHFRQVPKSRTETLVGWYSRIEKLCMCCGDVALDSFVWNYSRACHCGCDACGTREARTFVRFENRQRGDVCQGQCVLWRDEVGRYWAREWDSFKGDEQFRDLEVKEWR
jgi:hypothetical protein